MLIFKRIYKTIENCCIIKANHILRREVVMFKSEFCKISFLEKENAVLLEWKKFCKGEDYRKPLRFVLQLLRDNEKSNVIVDARNGFEDEKEDVEWAFNEFIPQMAETQCKKIIFITGETSDIEGEIDRFTNEFIKYFEVKRAASLEEAIKEFSGKQVLNVIYTVKEGKRDKFYKKVKKAGIIEASRQEKGCLRYDYYFPAEDKNQILLIEIWENQSAQDAHKEKEHYKALQVIKEKYVEGVRFEEYLSKN